MSVCRFSMISHGVVRRAGRQLVRLVLGGVLTIAVGTAPAFADPVAGAGPSDLSDYVAAALARHPALEAARARVQALERAADQADALPNLKLAWGEMLVPVETRVGPQRRILSLSQTVPWFGTLGLQRRQADLQAAAADARRQGAVLQVIRDVRAAWYELARLQAELPIQDALLALADQEATHFTAAYETGNGSYADLLRSRMRRQSRYTQAERVRDRLATQAVRLNLAAGLAPEVAVPQADLGPVVAPGRFPAERDSWAAWLEQDNPHLVAARLQAAGSEQGVALAGKRGGPDITLGLDYVMTDRSPLPNVTDSGKDPVIARLAVSVPLWGGRVEAGRQRAASDLRAARAEVAGLCLELVDRLEAQVFALTAAQDDVALYTDQLLPEARQLLSAAEAGYSSGRLPFADWAAARRHVLELELDRLRARTAESVALTELDQLLGGRLLAPSAPLPVPEKES